MLFTLVEDIYQPEQEKRWVIVSLFHKNADSHINITIEFGEGNGKIPVDKIVI